MPWQTFLNCIHGAKALAEDIAENVATPYRAASTHTASKNTKIATVKQKDSQEILSTDPPMHFSVLGSEHLDLKAPLW